jgi:hypothetical protein
MIKEVEEKAGIWVDLETIQGMPREKNGLPGLAWDNGQGLVCLFHPPLPLTTYFLLFAHILFICQMIGLD